MCISYSKRSRIEKKEVNRSSSFCCIARARVPFRMDGQMMSKAIVSDQMLAAEATNNGTQDGLMPQPCCNVTKHCEQGKLYPRAMSLIPGFFYFFILYITWFMAQQQQQTFTSGS